MRSSSHGSSPSQVRRGTGRMQWQHWASGRETRRGGGAWWRRAARRWRRRRLEDDLREARARRGGAMELGGAPAPRGGGERLDGSADTGSNMTSKRRGLAGEETWN
jgi:hypothetical protein